MNVTLANGAARSGTSLPAAVCLLTIALLAAMAVDVAGGDPLVSRVLPPAAVIRILAHHIPLISSVVPAMPTGSSFADAIVWQSRVPRSLVGALVGILLALAGVAFQGLLGNPLADPYMVGVSSGAAVGAVGVTLLGASGLCAGLLTPLAAFGCGLLAMGLVYGVARVRGRISVAAFLLAGVIVGTFLWSFIPLLIVLAGRLNTSGSQRSLSILAELFGSLNEADWRAAALLTPFVVVAAFLLFRSSAELNAMASGEESAAFLGVDTEALKRRVIVAGSLATAAAVSVCGIIAFVGLIVPHVARRIVGPDHRRLLPTAMLLGGLVIVLSDWISRALLFNIEIGVITSLMGAPVFCYLLRRQASSGA